MDKNAHIIINDKPGIPEMQYSKSNVEALINHLLSKQKHFTGGSYISVNDISEECRVLGFNINPEGKSL